MFLDDWLMFCEKYLFNDSTDHYDTFVNNLVSKIFEFFDTNKDGFISQDEYIDMFVAMGADRNYSYKVFDQLDVNGDKLISEEELLESINEFFKSDDPKAV